jgi:hypothetical protein
MRYPIGSALYVLWAVAAVVCVGFALAFKGLGLVMDWVVVSLLLYWRILSQPGNLLGPHNARTKQK